MQPSVFDHIQDMLGPVFIKWDEVVILLVSPYGMMCLLFLLLKVGILYGQPFWLTTPTLFGKHKTLPFFLSEMFTHLTTLWEVRVTVYFLFSSLLVNLCGWSLAFCAPFSSYSSIGAGCWILFKPIISESQIPMVPGTGVPALPSWLSSLVLFPLLHPKLHFRPLMFALGGPKFPTFIPRKGNSKFRTQSPFDVALLFFSHNLMVYFCSKAKAIARVIYCMLLIS